MSNPHKLTLTTPGETSGAAIRLALLLLLIPAASGCSGCDKERAPPPKTNEAPANPQQPEPEATEPPAEQAPENSRDEAPDDPATDARTAESPASETPLGEAESEPASDRQSSPARPESKAKSATAGPQRSANGSGESKASSGRSARSGRTRRKGSSGADPKAVASQAKNLFERAQKKSARGDHRGAYRDAEDAWEALRPFDADAECRALASRIFNQLDTFAENANREAGGADGLSGSTLIEK